MLIEIWSDVVCPWCYIGKRRLEKALASWVSTGSTSVGGSDAGRDVDIVYRSFQLDPSAPEPPTEVEPVETHEASAFSSRRLPM